jgi:hypothetical protein
MLNAECSRRNVSLLGIESWALFEHWALRIGHWALRIAHWALI